jgi:hypothetical protein
MLRTAALGLALLFVASQSVSWADCCCGSFCRHKNACTGCPPGEACPGGEQKTRTSSCCGEEESAPETTCSHFEPSSEIDTVSADAVGAAPAIVEFIASVEFFPAAPQDHPVPPKETGPPRAAPPCRLPLRI